MSDFLPELKAIVKMVHDANADGAGMTSTAARLDAIIAECEKHMAELRTEDEALREKLQPMLVPIMRADLAKLDKMVAIFCAISDLGGIGDLYDDAWNMRNGMVAYVEGEEHFDG